MVVVDTLADLLPTMCWCWESSSWMGSRCTALTGLLARLPLPVLLDLLGVLVGAVTVDVVVVVVEFEMAVVGAEVVDVEGVVVVVVEGVTGFSWLPKKGCRRIPELA